MRKHELIKMLKSAGYYKIKEGGSHEFWSDGKQKVMLPRSAKEIKTGTAKAILKQAGLNK